MHEIKPQRTPMVIRQVKIKEAKITEEIEEAYPCIAPYREAIGNLLYLADATRPDIGFAINFLSRKQRSPTENDWTDVKRILRYLRETPDLGLTFRANKDNLEAFSDASFRNCENSTSQVAI